MKEIICPKCKKWNKGDLRVCSFCNSVLDSNKIRKNEMKLTNTGANEIKTQPVWVEKLITRAQESKNPVVRFLVKSAVAVWMVYMALVGFILWSVAWLAG